VALADQLVSLHRFLRARRRVRWDWAIPLVALLAFLTLVQIWWTIAQPGARSLTIGAFLPTLVELVLLLLLASAVLPDEVPSEGLDLRAYYHENGGYIWTLFAAALAWLVFTDLVSTSSRIGLYRAALRQQGEFMVLAVMLSLVFVRNRWWNGIALLALSSGPAGWLSRSLG